MSLQDIKDDIIDIIIAHEKNQSYIINKNGSGLYTNGVGPTTVIVVFSNEDKTYRYQPSQDEHKRILRALDSFVVDGCVDIELFTRLLMNPDSG